MAKAFRALSLIADVAERYVGTRGTGGRGNNGEQVSKFQGATWLAGSGWPWCAAFVSHCVQQAARERKFDIVSITNLPRTPRAYDFDRSWADANNALVFTPSQIPPFRPRRGDIVVFNFSHVGIVRRDYDGGGWIFTVEGNTSPDAQGNQRDGSGVFRKRRSMRVVRSFVRPAFRAKPA